MKSEMRLCNLLVASVLLMSVVFGGMRPQQVLAAAPIALSTTVAYTQNFDDMAHTAAAALPTDWAVSKDATNVRTVGTFAAASTATAVLGGNNLSSSASNGIYNFGAGDPANATDRAVGFLASGSATKSGNLYAYFNNGTGADLAAVRISYNVEKYRNGSNPSGFTMQLSYSLNGTTWTPAGMAFKTSFDPDGDNNGYASAPGATQSVSNRTLIVTIPSGSDFYLAWNYSVTATTTTSNAQALAVDDFSILGIDGSTSTNPEGTGAAAPKRGLAGYLTTLLTVAVTPGINPLTTNLNVTCDLSPIGGPAIRPFYDDATMGDVTAGDNIFSFSTTVDSSVTPGVKSLACTIGVSEEIRGSATIAISIDPLLPIGTVNGAVLDTDNGATHVSPYTGQIVNVQGVIYENTLQAISNSTNSYKGFFIQNTTALADGIANTSDGLFVYMNTNSTINGPSGAYTPVVGDEVIISGTISEYYNMTELTSPVLVAIKHSGLDISAAVPAFIPEPPVSLAAANRYWERLQGMRVQVPQDSLVVSGRNVFSPPDGEIWIVSPDSTVADREDLYMNRAFRDAHPLDDNYDAANWDGNGYRMLMGSWGIKGTTGDANALIDPARTFDTLTNTPAGGINYSFSKYRIEVTTQPTFALGPDPAANNPPQVFNRDLGYSIADYNLENLYDYRDNPFSGCDFTGNTGCAQVAPFLAGVTPPYDYVPASNAEYQARLNDIALQIINDLHNPDILMLQEIENQDICTVTGGALVCGLTDNADGKPDVLQELALKIAANNGPAYDAAWDRASSDLRGIAPAYLYRTDRVELLPAAGDPVLSVDPAIGYAGATVAHNSTVANPKTLNAVLPGTITGTNICESNWVFPRAPDVGLFRIYQTSIGAGSYRDVYLINNHFKSGPDTCVAHRTEQAKYNAALVAFIQAAKPDAGIVMGGDLNVYPRPDDPFAPIGQPTSSDQLGSLYNPALGLKNMWDVMVKLTPESAYSYVYVGMAQTLDQMFINPVMMANLSQVRVAHINSDFPSDFPGDVARGTSDHDPLVTLFGWAPQTPSVNAGGPYQVNQATDVQLTANGNDPTGGPLSYAWDLNNDGTYETLGQSVTYHAGVVPGDHMVAVKVTGGTGLTQVDKTTVVVNPRALLPLMFR